jgi:L-fucose isomerase-like protein
MEEDVIEAAKCYFVFKKILAEEKADALMMNCLPGLRKPHKHVPPCMGFTSLQDEVVPMGCQADLHATLTIREKSLVTRRFHQPVDAGLMLKLPLMNLKGAVI